MAETFPQHDFYLRYQFRLLQGGNEQRDVLGNFMLENHPQSYNHTASEAYRMGMGHEEEGFSTAFQHAARHRM